MRLRLLALLVLVAASKHVLAEKSPYAVAIQHEQTGSYDVAIEYYRRAAGLGLSDAEFALGRLYRDRYYDLPNSINWFSAAAEHGNVFAQYEIGMMYKTGNAVLRKDREKAASWLTKAASHRHKSAMYHLSELACCFPR